jgi:hypothetical protein
MATLTTLLFIVGNSTNYAFAPTALNNPLSFFRPNGAAKQKNDPNNSLFDTPSYRTSKKHSSSLGAHSMFFQFAQQHASSSAMVLGLPKALALIKDASGPLSSILDLDPEKKAECLMNISHLLLDVTAFFKFDGTFLKGAQLIGRISYLMIHFLPGHAFHVEEIAVELFLLVVSIQKMIPDAATSQTTTAQEEEASNNNIQNEPELELDREQQQQQQVFFFDKPGTNVDYSTTRTSQEEYSIAPCEEADLELELEMSD